jgi:hypothetical protein
MKSLKLKKTKFHENTKNFFIIDGNDPNGFCFL